jgi:hypothetical protein
MSDRITSVLRAFVAASDLEFSLVFTPAFNSSTGQWTWQCFGT